MAQRKRFQFGETDKMLSPINEAENSRKDISMPVQEQDVQTQVQNIMDRIDEPVNTAFYYKFIKREKIIFSKENDYPIEAVEKIANSILELGLIHNIEVFYNEDQDIYVVDSGEQRTRAIDLLIKKYKDFGDKDSVEYKKYQRNVQLFSEKGYPCKVVLPINDDTLTAEEAALCDDITRQIRIIAANEIDRDKNPSTTLKKINELNELLKKRQELLTHDKKININEEIGKVLKISDRQVTKYKAIEKLIPELQELFEKSGITLNDGANYAKLSEDEQRQILALIEAGEGKKEVNALYEKLNRLQTEIVSQERNIKALENEKNEALKKIEEQKNSAALLEEKIRTELQNEKTKEDEKQVRKLQEQLDSVNASLKQYKQKVAALEKEQEKKVAELEEKLSVKEKNKPAASPAVIRNALQIEGLLSTIASSMKQLNMALKDYEAIYEESCGEKSPEEYKELLEKIIK